MSETIPVQTKWYHSTVFIILSCLFCFPLGLILLWTNKAQQGLLSTTKAKGILTAIVAVLFFISVSGGSKTGDNSSSSSSSSSSDSEPAKAVGSPDQVKFHQQFNVFAGKYRQAGNEMKKSAVYREMAAFSRAHIPTATIQNWEGKLTKIGTDEGGQHSYITIESDFGDSEIEYKTWNNALSDMGDGTMIPLGTPVYKQLEQLNEGDHVVFSGRLIFDAKAGFKQGNMIESSLVTDPEILVVFTSIKKK